MKTIRLLLVAAALAALSSAPARAEPAPAVVAAAPAAAGAPVYAFVDIPAILGRTEAGKEIRAATERKSRQLEAEMREESNALQSAMASFSRQRDGLSPDQAKEKHAELESKYQSLRSRSDADERKFHRRQVQLNKGSGEALSKLQDVTVHAIAKIMKERGYAAVFSQEAVVLAANDLDITAEVIRRVNEKVTSIPIDWSGGAEKSGGSEQSGDAEQKQ